MKKTNLILILIVLVGAFLRIFQVENNPPGLYIDEVSIGYNAFSILEKGVDEHGLPFPLFFEAFGEYKMPVYIYSVTGVMMIIGKVDLAVRLPSIIAGISTIFLLYFFVKRMLVVSKTNINKELVSQLSAFLLAITPWHIHFSRAGFEANMALFFYLLGLYLLLIFWSKKTWRFLISSFLLFAVSIYTYNSYRVIAPLTVGITSLIIFLRHSNLRKKITTAFILFLILIAPIIQFSLTDAGTTRYAETSTFSQYENKSPSEKRKLYPMVVVKNYISYFSFGFIFASGDGNGRHQIPGFGLFLHYLLPFVLIGVFWIISQKKSLFKNLVLYLLFIAPLPASVVAPNPHTLRSFLMVIPIVILASVGIAVFFKKVTKVKKFLLLFVILAAIYETSLYLHQYYFHYYKVNSPDWGAGYKEMSMKASGYAKEYDHIVVDKNLSNAKLYLNFYDDSIDPVFVDPDWSSPDGWGEGNVIYIRPFYGDRTRPEIIDQVYLPGREDIHAQFWKL